jgi:hypothetical protein
VSTERGCWHDDLAHRVGLIVHAERDRLARRRPELDGADLAAVEDTLWRIADHLLLRRARQVTVDPVAAARLWDAPVRGPRDALAAAPEVTPAA